MKFFLCNASMNISSLESVDYLFLRKETFVQTWVEISRLYLVGLYFVDLPMNMLCLWDLCPKAPDQQHKSSIIPFHRFSFLALEKQID